MGFAIRWEQVLSLAVAAFLLNSCGRAPVTPPTSPDLFPSDDAPQAGYGSDSMVDDLLGKLGDVSGTPLTKPQVQQAGPTISDLLMQSLQEVRKSDWWDDGDKLSKFVVAIAQEAKRTDDELKVLYALCVKTLTDATDKEHESCTKNIPKTPPLAPGTDPKYAAQFRKFHKKRIQQQKDRCNAEAKTALTHSLTLLYASIVTKRQGSGALPALFQAMTGKALPITPSGSSTDPLTGGTGGFLDFPSQGGATASGSGTGSGIGTGSGTGSGLGIGIGLGF